MQTIGDRVVLERDWSVREAVAHGAREAPVVLITGCSTGIGRAAAGAFVAAGYRVVATARDPETLAGVGAAQIARMDPDYVHQLALTAQRPEVRAAARQMVIALEEIAAHQARPGRHPGRRTRPSG